MSTESALPGHGAAWPVAAAPLEANSARDARVPGSLPNKARVAIWWFFASEITIFGGFVACYILYRLAHPEWAHQATHMLRWAGALNTVLLLTSSLTVLLAHEAAQAKAFGKAGRLVGVTFALGLAFLGIKGFEWTHEISHGLTPHESLFWGFYFLGTGLHALHLIAGLIALAVVGLAVRRGRNPGRVEIAGMYWHFVDVVWAVLFPLFYLLS